MCADRTQYVTTDDGVRLAYEQAGESGPVIVLLHGWSGSRNYYDRNARALGRRCRVYAYDHRFHGDSDSPPWGHHVARLAADLRDFLAALDLQDVTVVGSSMGAAVIWSYVELFGQARLKGAVFVDQAPLQNLAADWATGSTGCYDAESLARLQCTLKYSFSTIAEGNLDCCLAAPRTLGKAAEQVLVEETMRCDPVALGKLMADHTQLDWRPLLPRLRLPCLNLVGGRSGVFHAGGCAHVGQLVPKCHTVTFKSASHWLYLENPEAFNEAVGDFAAHGLPGVKHLHEVP